MSISAIVADMIEQDTCDANGNFDAEKKRQQMEAQRKREAHAAILEHQKNIVAYKIWRCCQTCDYFTSRRRIVNTQTVNDFYCSKFNALPPPHIILHGCEDYENDIPF